MFEFRIFSTVTIDVIVVSCELTLYLEIISCNFFLEIWFHDEAFLFIIISMSTL